MKAGKNDTSLWVWIAGVEGIGLLIGSLTKAEVKTWYSTLNRSPLTPPNYAFPIAWTLLYFLIAIAGWVLWRQQSLPNHSLPNLRLIKSLYGIQLILNWSWTPLFFVFHVTGVSFACLLIMNALVSLIVYLSYRKIRFVSLLMSPYLIWILLAAHLNFYIWQHN